MEQNWIKRRWFDFRLGHGLYLIFALTGANFILIFHRLLIERVPILDEIFGNLLVFAGIFILAYIPVAVIVGLWHKKSILKVDNEQYIRQNPVFARLFRILMDIQTGRASKEEIENIREFLVSIEEGRG